MPLTQLFLSITTPSLSQFPPIRVERTFTVAGVLTWNAPGWARNSTSVRAKVGNSSWVSVNTSGNWSISLSAEGSVLPDTELTVTVEANGRFSRRDGEGELDIDTPSTSATFQVKLPARIPPNLSIDATPATIIANQLPLNFTFTVRASGVQKPIQTFAYYVGEEPFHTPINLGNDWSNWPITLPLPPAIQNAQTLTVRVEDQYGTQNQVTRSFKVLPQPPIVVPPGSRTTFTGAPTNSSVTSWTRLEPQSTAADMGLSSSARVFDPLWFLTRQWQMGEFQGEDAGTPVLARARATSAKLARSFVGALPKPPNADPMPVVGTQYDAARTPLEVITERRRMRGVDVNDARMLNFAVESGLHFLRMLEQKALSKSYRAVFITKLALQPIPETSKAVVDDATVRYLQSMVGRAPDGRMLSLLLRNPGAAQLVLDPALGIATADHSKVQEAATAWLAWYDSLYSEPTGANDDAWIPSRFEYAMSVGARLSANAQDDVTFAATEVDGTPLDWSSFDLHPQIMLTTAADQSTTSLVEVTIPAPVSFPGAPASRFWEMEDGKVAYGLVPVGPTDIAHLLMIEYASTYGNDWFIVPMTVPVGSVTRVDSLVVTDTFGVRSLVRPIGDPALPAPYFSMWQSAYQYPVSASTPKVAANRFFLPPTLPRTIDSAPLEDVLFMRDEMANLAWAIERVVESPIEQPARRNLADENSAEDPADAAADNGLPRYLLSSRVPENWIPFLPVQLPNPAAPPNTPGQIISRLKRGAVLQPDGSRRVHSAVSELLNTGADLLLYDEEVPRDGVHITRRRRMTRWTDGSTWVWTALRNDTGQGEGSSGLQFDQAGEN